MSHPDTYGAPRAKKTGLVIVLALIVGFFYPVQAKAVAYSNIYVLQTPNIRFGTGSETSIGADGFLKQPWYKSGSTWYKLTYSNYPLRYAIATSDDTYSGTTGWNLSGNLMSSEGGGFSSMTIEDASQFVTTSTAGGLNIGYGTLVVSVNVTTGSRTFKFTNTYVIGQSDSFVKITSKISNTSGVTMKNSRLWVGTNDDWVGNSDGPNKQRGNINTGSFMLTDKIPRKHEVKRLKISFSLATFNLTSSISSAVSISMCPCNLLHKFPSTLKEL